MKSDPQNRPTLCYLQRRLQVRTVQQNLRENAVGHRLRREEAPHQQFLAEHLRLRANGNVWTPAKALQGWVKGEEQGSQSEGLLEKSHLCVTIVL